jgi:alpha-D-xyloside xylohydrolase
MLQSVLQAHGGGAFGRLDCYLDAPAERFRLFVWAGAIVPMGPVTQYVDQQRAAALTVVIYTGANGRFSLYEDDGRFTAYKQVAFSRLVITYDDRAGTVRIGAREGPGWEGMPTTLELRAKWVRPDQSWAEANAAGAQMTYSG